MNMNYFKIMDWTNNDFNNWLDGIVGENWSNFISIIVMLFLFIVLTSITAKIAIIIKDIWPF